MEKKLMVFVLLGGCVLAAPAEAQTVEEPAYELPRFEQPRVPPIAMPEIDLLWQPRSHPQGTLLVDHEGELWMVTSDGERRVVTGDDILGEVGMDAHDAIPMSLEEERCLMPNLEEYWGPGNNAWQPIWGPDEEDRGPFILDWEHRVRSRTSTEALDSWGYYSRWTDYFDGDLGEWASFTDATDPVVIRDGTLVRTELGTYYIVHARAYLFRPARLATQAGYHADDMQEMRESRLRELVRVTTSFTRETFELCPADEGI